MLKQAFTSKPIFTKFKLLQNPITAGALFLFSLLVFTFNNTHEQLWYDETLGMYISEVQFPEMLKTVAQSGAEANPPFYHLLLKSVRTLFGSSIFTARCFSGVLGSFFILLLYFFSRSVFSETVALISSLMIIFNPVIIQYTQDIRMYILATLLTCIIQFSFFLAIQRKRNRYWIIYTVATIAGIYTHNYLLLTIPANFVFFAIVARQHQKLSTTKYNAAVRYTLSLAAIVAAYLPWVPYLLLQSSQMQKATWTEPATIGVLFKTIAYFYTSKFTLDINPLFPYQTLTAGGIFFIVLKLYRMAKDGVTDERVIFLLSTIFVPGFLVFTYSFFGNSIIILRHFIPFFPFFIILLVLGICTIRNRKIQKLISAVFILANIPAIFVIYTSNFNGSAYETSEYIKRVNPENNPVIVFDRVAFLPIYYYSGKPANIYHFPEENIPDCYGTSMFSNQLIDKISFPGILRDKTAFWIVLTPYTKESPKIFLNTISNVFHPDSTHEKTFIYKNSWIRTKVVKYTRDGLNIGGNISAVPEDSTTHVPEKPSASSTSG